MPVPPVLPLGTALRRAWSSTPSHQVCPFAFPSPGCIIPWSQSLLIHSWPPAPHNFRGLGWTYSYLSLLWPEEAKLDSWSAQVQSHKGHRGEFFRRQLTTNQHSPYLQGEKGTYSMKYAPTLAHFPEISYSVTVRWPRPVRQALQAVTRLQHSRLDTLMDWGIVFF